MIRFLYFLECEPNKIDLHLAFDPLGTVSIYHLSLAFDPLSVFVHVGRLYLFLSDGFFMRFFLISNLCIFPVTVFST